MIFIKHKYRPEDGRQKTEDIFIAKLQASGFRLRAMLTFVISILLVITSACNSNRVFEEHKGLKNYSWNRFEKIPFELTIEEVVGNYDIYIAIRYIHGVPYRIIRSGMLIKFPDGEERYNDYDLNIRNKDGSYKGSVAGDIWDCSILVLKNYPLPRKGTYSFIIHNLMEKLETPGIMEVGLIVEKSAETKK